MSISTGNAMKKFVVIFILLGCLLTGCTKKESAQLAATTLPVWEFTTALCEGSGISVARIVTENVSCLHDYTLQISQMRAVENADAVICSGLGLEGFLEDVLSSADCVIDASGGITPFCADEHSHEEHHHEHDPHIWLSPENAKQMCRSICDGLCDLYPDYRDLFKENLIGLITKLDNLQTYGESSLKELSCRDLITFHDGFRYFAESFHLTILKAVEEESGSEASAQELVELIGLVEDQNLPAVFTERNGATAAAEIIAKETGVKIYALDMAMAGESYFDAMYHNIDTIKEALG